MAERFARERVRHELLRRRLTVLRTERPAPGFVRVTFGGADLAGFASPGPADHVKVFFPVAGSAGADGAERVSRDYTPLAFRAAGPGGLGSGAGSGSGSASGGPELDVDFYLHGVPAAGAIDVPADAMGGPAAAWAAAGQPGDEIEIGGPRGSALPPVDADELILVADESALPSVARWLEALPDVPVTGLFAVADPAVAAYLEAHAAAHRAFRWFSGQDRDAALEAELRGMPIGAGTFCFLAGEATALIPLRRYLRRELALPKAQVDVHGYWKRGTAGHDHHAPVDPSDDD